MPRIRSTGIQLRDEEIIAAARRGVPRRDIAALHDISEARVSQIVTRNQDPRFPDEDLRGWLLEGYFGDLLVIQEIKEGPGRAITSGKGEHVIDAVTGEPAYDPSPRIDAVRTAAQVRKNIAQLMGTEKVTAKPAEVQPGLQELIDWTEAGMIEQKKQDALKDALIADLQAQLAIANGATEADVVDHGLPVRSYWNPPHTAPQDPAGWLMIQPIPMPSAAARAAAARKMAQERIMTASPPGRSGPRWSCGSSSRLSG